MSTRPQQPYVVARLVDESGSRAEMRLSVRRSTSRDAGMSGAQLLADLADAASSCAAIETELRYPVAIQPPAAPAAGSNVRGVGVLIFTTTDPEQYSIIEIPGISASLIDPADPNQLVLTAPALLAYISALTTGIYCNPFGYSLLACVAGLYELRQA